MNTLTRVDRRAFIKTAGAAAALAGGVEGILAAGRAPAFAQGAKLHLVRWVDFIPEADVELKRQMPEASKAIGAEVVLETINANDLQPRITAAIQSGAGADIFMMAYNWPQLYQAALADVSDVAEAVGKEQGGFYGVYKPSFQTGGKWLGVPHSIVGNAIAYRKSWFKEVGYDAFPKTWDDLRKASAALKKKGKPYGQTIDAPMKGYRTAAGASRMFGYEGPPSAKATEAYSKYIIVDMYAKAVQGMKAEDAVKWAAGELKKIYG